MHTDFDYKSKICVSSRVCSNYRNNFFYLLNNFPISDTIDYPFVSSEYVIDNATVLITDDLGHSTSLSYLPLLGYINDSLLFKFNEGRAYSILVTTPDGRKASSIMSIPIGTSVKSFSYDTSFVAYQGGGFSSVKRDVGLSLGFDGSNFYNHSYADVFYSVYFKTYSGFDSTVVLSSSFDFEKKAIQYFQPTNLSVLGTVAYYNDSAVFYRVDIDSIFYYIETEDDIYSKYLKSIQLQKSLSDDPFAEPALLNSNIKDGLGVFCGYARRTKKIKFK